MFQIPDPFVYGIVVGLVSAFGAIFASRVASRATRSSADAVLAGVSRQIEYQTAAKLAEFRQAWINELRDCMSEVQSYGVTPELDHDRERAFYKFGTKVELLMNRSDPRFHELQDRMYEFLAAKTRDEKYRCNAPFIQLCQGILKVEWETLKRELNSVNTSRRSKELP